MTAYTKAIYLRKRFRVHCYKCQLWIVQKPNSARGLPLTDISNMIYRCYTVSKLHRITRNFVNIFFATPPTSSFEEVCFIIFLITCIQAPQYFLKAEEGLSHISILTVFQHNRGD